MADSKKYSRVLSEYQELTNIANSGTQYIDTGLKGSDLADCEVEIVMRNDTGITTSYNFNGTYLSGSTAQLGLVATSSSECRSSMNFGFADAVSTTGLSLSDYHTLYATNGLQKVDDTVVGTLNFGTLNDGNFLLFARTNPNQPSGASICAAMSLKSFTVKRNNQYIRNMLPVRRISDSVLGLYDAANDVFYTNQGTGTFTAGSEVNNWQHSLRKLTTATEAVENPLYSDGTAITAYTLKGNTVQNGTPTPSNPVEVNGVGVRTENLCPTTWVQGDIDSATGANDVSNDAIRSDFIPIEQNKYYSIYRSIKGGFVKIRLYDNSKAYVGSGTNRISLIVGGAGATPTNPLNGTDNFCCIQIISSSAKYMRIVDTTNNLSTAYMFVEGEYTAQTMPSYEPYGYKIPISSGGVTTNIYLGSTQTVRQVKKLVLTGEETGWIESVSAFGYRFSIPITSAMQSDTTVGVRSMCTHQELTSTGNTYNALGVYTITGTSQLIMTLSRDTRLASWKSWLAAQYANGTPVTVWYVLATPETAAVNEPLMKIGTYADTLSNATAIPTTEGANSITVDTTVQPSEFTATWTGWHDASVKEYDGSQWNE